MSKKTFIVTLAAVFFLVGCGGDPAPNPGAIEKVTKMLTSNGGKWSPAPSMGVTVDGVDVTDDLFAGFSITFHEKTFTTTGTTPVWLREDTWRFKDKTANVIIRGQDQKEITITEISETQLKLTLEWTATTTSQGGRQHSLKGTHEFLLTRQ